MFRADSRLWLGMGTPFGRCLPLFILLFGLFSVVHSQQNVAIGVVLPITHPVFGIIGQEAAAGFLLGTEYVNAQPFKGGVLSNINMSVIVLDGIENATLYEQLDNDPNVYLICGPPGDLATSVALDSTSDDLAIVGPYTGSPSLFTSDPFYRRLIGLRGGVGDELAAIVEFATNTLRLSRISLADGTFLSPLNETLNTVLEAVGQRIITHARVTNIPDIGDIWGPADTQTIVSGDPRIIIIGITPGASSAAIIQCALDPSLSQDAVFFVTSTASAFLPNLLRDECILTPACTVDTYVSLLDRIFVISHLGPFRATQVEPGSILDEFEKALNSTSLNPATDFPAGFPNDNLAIEVFENVLWIARIMETLSGVDVVNRTTFLDGIYAAPFLTVADVRFGIFLDDCSIDGLFTCCNNGVRKLNVLGMALPPWWNASTFDVDPTQVAVLTKLDADGAVFEWDGCTAVLDDVALPYVFGMSGSFTNGSSVDIEQVVLDVSSDVQVGILAGMELRSLDAVFGGRSLRLVFGDNEGSLNQSLTITQDLLNVDNVISMTGYASARQAFSDLGALSTPVLGLLDLSLTYRKVQYYEDGDDFASQAVFVAPSVVDNAVGALGYLQSLGGSVASNVAVWYDDENGQDRELKVVERAFKELYSGKFIRSVQRGESASLDGSEEAVLLMATLAPPEELAVTIDQLEASGSTSPIYVVAGTLEPEEVVRQLIAIREGARRQVPRGSSSSACDVCPRVLFAQGLPALGDNSSGVVQSYLRALSAFDSSFVPTYSGLLGHLSASLISSVVQRINGDVTADRVRDTLYLVQRFNVDDVILGPYVEKSDEDDSSSDASCNQGLSTVYVQSFQGNSSNATQLPSSWLTEFELSSTTCGVDVTRQSGDGSDSLSAGAIFGITLGAATPVIFVAFLCMCCCVLAVVLILVALLLIQTYRIRIVSEFGSSSGPKEPDYALLLFNNDELDITNGTQRYLSNVPISFSGKSAEAVLELFAELIIDSQHNLTIINGIADNITTDLGKFCLYLTYAFHYDGQALTLLEGALDVELDEQESSTIFRQDSLLSKMFNPFCRLVGLPYLWHILADTVYDIHGKSVRSATETSNNGSTAGTISMGTSTGLELDPKRMESSKNKDSVVVSSYQLKLYAITIFQKVRNKIQFPEPLREFFQMLAEKVNRVLPDSLQQAMANFVFLRFICPAISSPQRYGILDEPPSTATLRSLILLSKVLQNLANNVAFEKEEYMKAMNDFIVDHSESMREWSMSLAGHDDLEAETVVDGRCPSVSKETYDTCIKMLYGFACSKSDELNAYLKERVEPSEYQTLLNDYLVPTQLHQLTDATKPSKRKKRRRSTRSHVPLKGGAASGAQKSDKKSSSKKSAAGKSTRVKRKKKKKKQEMMELSDISLSSSSSSNNWTSESED